MNLKPLIFASAVALVLNGCSSSSSTTAADTGGLSVLAISGTTTGLNGTYKTGCYNSGGFKQETIVISGNTWNYTDTAYGIDAACTSTGTVQGTIAATIAVGVDSAITGWTNNNVPTQVRDDVTLLSDSESYTLINMTISAGTGDFGSIPSNTATTLFYIVDDSGNNNILYRDDDIDAGSTLANGVDSFTKQQIENRRASISGTSIKILKNNIY